MYLGNTPFISWHREGDTAWIDLLFVPRDKRRKGYGRSMVAAVIEKLPEEVCGVEVLSTQLDDEFTTGFWEKLGFEPEIEFGELFNGTYLRKALARLRAAGAETTGFGRDP
jgi:GNAT superfamily N-acetyltransferase